MNHTIERWREYIYTHIHITVIMKLTTYPWFGVNPLDEVIKNPFTIVFILQNKADKRIQETWICYTPYEQIKISSGSYQFFHGTLKYITQNCGPGTSYEFITENTHFSTYDKSKCNSQCVTALFVLHTLFYKLHWTLMVNIWKYTTFTAWCSLYYNLSLLIPSVWLTKMCLI